MLFFNILKKKKKKITRESFLHVFFHTPSECRIHFLTWRGSGYRDVITHGYVQDELLLDFLLGLFFFLIHTCFVHVNGLEKDSNTIDITRDKDQRFIFQHSFIIFLCREFDKKRIMARDNFPSHNGRQCFKNYFKINLAGEISRSLSLSCSDPRLYSDMLKRSCSNRPAINNFGVL